MTALVFNCNYNGLAIIQELGRRGVAVRALDRRRSVGTASRYSKYHCCPDPGIAENDFISFLLDMAPEFADKPVLFPTNDQWAIAISRYKEKLSEFYIPCVADHAAIDLVIQKQNFYDWGSSRGYPVPRSWRGTAIRDIPDDAFPLAAKPEFRRTATNDPTASARSRVLDENRLTILRSREEVAAFRERHASLIECFLFQEYVEGLSDCMYTVGIYADVRHEVVAMFTGRKVRGYPPDIGDCVVGQVEDVPQSLKKLTRLICKEIGYHGIAEFEFKRDAVTGEYKLIEINPRSWSWVGITPACGVSLPWIAYSDLTGLEIPETSECDLPDGSVKYVKLIEDWQNCMWRNRRAGYLQWDKSFREWRRSLKADRVVLAEFAPDDIRPGIYAVVRALRSPIRSLVYSVRSRLSKE
jgi:predicted ATP-grasp superfamily ATP-dependent carboligase